MDTNHELSYLAGFFDGEGCVSVGKNKITGRHGSLMVTAAQIDPKPLVRFQQQFGGYILRRRDGRGFRSTHQWRASGRDAVAMLRELLPYLMVKADEAKVAIDYQDGIGVPLPKTPESRVIELARRESLYQQLRAMKHRAYEDFEIPPSKRPGRPPGRPSSMLTAGPGSRPNGPKPPHRPQDPDRLEQMQKMRAEGATYAAIGAAFGIKRAAAHHILKRWSTNG